MLYFLGKHSRIIHSTQNTMILGAKHDIAPRDDDVLRLGSVGRIYVESPEYALTTTNFLDSQMHLSLIHI